MQHKQPPKSRALIDYDKSTRSAVVASLTVASFLLTAVVKANDNVDEMVAWGIIVAALVGLAGMAVKFHYDERDEERY